RDTPLARLVGSRPPLSLIEPIVRRLADAGADLDSPSPYPLQLGERPLHVAAKKALLGWVILLLELGANPLATGDDGRTPRQSVEALIATKKEHTEYDEILGLLAKAERAHRNG
ncbi:MAG: ankyrin repeat domain-containing protein, partial [Planctomycetota bacterium]